MDVSRSFESAWGDFEPQHKASPVALKREADACRDACTIPVPHPTVDASATCLRYLTASGKAEAVIDYHDVSPPVWVATVSY